MKNNSSSIVLLSIIAILQIVFLLLKISGFIDWNWGWVLAPTWIPCAFVLLIIGIIFIVAIIQAFKTSGDK